MAWRAIIINNPAKLRIEQDQLVVTQEREVSLPLEDLAALVLESPAVTFSSALLARLAARDILLLACDEKHLPCMMALPCAGHSRLAKQQRLQLESTLPFRKRCWQVVVSNKVANQAACLGLLRREGAERLAALLPRITSGDAGNVESGAARLYFRALGGEEFTREADIPLNAALNYGYAIVRGAVARALAAHGLLLAQGIHHCSELNPFNLADDFIEPLRPVVDLFAIPLMAGVDELAKEQRMALAALLGCDVLIDGERQPVLRAVEVMAASFVTAIREKDPRALKLPSLLPIGQHAYE